MKIHIPTPLRAYTGQKETIEVSGATVGGALEQLVTTYPELRGNLFGSDGLPQRRRHPLPARQGREPGLLRRRADYHSVDRRRHELKLLD
jgi:molybdopterin converting factor small subunit